MAILAFMVASSAVSLLTVAVSWAMAVRLLDVAVTKFMMTSTVSCCRYPLSGCVVALCAVQ